MAHREVHISVDCETSGSVPGIYSLLTLGACVVDDDSKAFSASFKPISEAFELDAMKVNGLDLADLAVNGMEPEEALVAFATWISSVLGTDGVPVFVGLAAAFDWQFVNWYFLRFFGTNPFGFAPLDIKALYMGAFGVPWQETRSSLMDKRLGMTLAPDHSALGDARYQAELFRRIMAHIAARAD